MLHEWTCAQGSHKCGCSGCSCTHTFFSKAVLYPQKSIKTRQNSGISPQVKGIWFTAPTVFKLLRDPWKGLHKGCLLRILTEINAWGNTSSLDFEAIVDTMDHIDSFWMKTTRGCRLAQSHSAFCLFGAENPPFIWLETIEAGGV